MPDEEFRRRVYEAGSYLPVAPRDEAIAHHEHIGKIENRDVKDCVQLAGRLVPYLAADPKSADDPIAAMVDATALRASTEQQEMIAPEVARVREDLWGGVATAPFPSLEEASDWLGSFGGKERTAKENTRARALFTELMQDPRKAEIERITGAQINMEYRSHTVPYIAPDGHYVVHAVVPHGDPFVALGEVANRLADATGFLAASVVMHILADFPLVLPSIRITKTMRFGGGRRGSVRAEFNSPDVTHAQIANVLRLVRESWGKSSKKRLTPDNVRLLEIVDQVARDLGLEGVPDVGKKEEFFVEVHKLCRKERPGSYEKSGWLGPYTQWKRLRDKLGTKEED